MKMIILNMKTIYANMLKAIENAIDKKAESKNIFWKFLFWFKVFLWQIKSRISWKIHTTSPLIFKTKPFFCNPEAQAEIHTLIGHKYLEMYLLAIKSLLRFYNDVAVIVHDDGSLSQEDKEILKTHVKGIRIIDFDFADNKVNNILGIRRKSIVYRSNNIIAKLLFDYSLLSSSGKVISLDADILFLKYPIELIKWIKEDNKEIISNYEEFSYYQDITLKEINYDYQPNLNTGFFCFYKDIVNLDLIEEILAKTKKIHFCTEQYIFSILIKKYSDKYKFSFFDPLQYQTKTVFKANEPIFRHYLSSSGIYKKYLKDSEKVLYQLL